MRQLIAIFSCHGISPTLVSDNEPQLDSHRMVKFAETYNFNHVTSSPHYPQANGQAERSVKTAKNLLEYSPYLYVALVSYRATPMPWCRLSLAELLMGRHIKTDVSQVKEHFIPEWPYLEKFKSSDKMFKIDQKHGYERHHRVRPVPSLPNDLPLWLQT